MSISAETLAILRCPKSLGELVLVPAGLRGDAEFLFCPTSRLRYEIDEGVCVLLIDEATELDAQDAEALMADLASR